MFLCLLKSVAARAMTTLTLPVMVPEPHQVGEQSPLLMKQEIASVETLRVSPSQ